MQPVYLGPGRHYQDCLAYSLGLAYPVGIECLPEYLEPASFNEATHLAVGSDIQSCHHVMKIDNSQNRTLDPALWQVTSKLAKRAGVYQHLASHVLASTITSWPFPLDPTDPGQRFAPFPGYPGILIPLKTI